MKYFPSKSKWDTRHMKSIATSRYIISNVFIKVTLCLNNIPLHFRNFLCWFLECSPFCVNRYILNFDLYTSDMTIELFKVDDFYNLVFIFNFPPILNNIKRQIENLWIKISSGSHFLHSNKFRLDFSRSRWIRELIVVHLQELHQN